MSELLNALKSEWDLAQHGAMSRVPLYHQLYSVLKAAILDGTIPHEEQMPTEQQLAATFDVSRITAKRAMDEHGGVRIASVETWVHVAAARKEHAVDSFVFKQSLYGIGINRNDSCSAVPSRNTAVYGYRYRRSAGRFWVRFRILYAGILLRRY